MFGNMYIFPRNFYIVWHIIEYTITFQILHIKNRSTINQHQVKGILRVDAVTYTGVTGDGVKRHEFDIVVTPEAKEKVTLLVTFDDYYKKLIDQVSLYFLIRFTLITVFVSNFKYTSRVITVVCRYKIICKCAAVIVTKTAFSIHK